MLAADKLQLQSALKQQATALKEKEFNLHHSNLSEYYTSCFHSDEQKWVNTTTCLTSTIASLAVCCLSPLRYKVTVGTQAAVLAGLDITMFIEFNPPHNNEWVSTIQ